MVKNNSGSRLHALLVSIAATSSRGRAAKDVWAQMFELDPNENIRTELAVMEHMLWIHSEVEATLQAMHELKMIPSNLYEPQLSRVTNFLGPTSMAPDFDNTRSVLTPDVMNSVATCAALLPDEEHLISKEDLESLLALSTELEALLNVSTLPLQLQALLRRHLMLINRALQRYSINGAKALREAVYSALGELATAGEALKPYSDAPEAQKLSELWTKAGNVADAAIKTDGLIQIGERLAKLLS